MRKKVWSFVLIGLISGGLSPSLLFSEGVTSPSNIKVDPLDFDFGWAPEDAMISADFVITNIGSDVLDLQNIYPTCGCTAVDFTPEKLASHSEKKFQLTFNTRGYGGRSFDKPADVDYNDAAQQLSVHLKGFVTNPDAIVVPNGTGIASFEPGAKSDTKIEVMNKSKNPVTLSLVQKPAEWVKLKGAEETIKPESSIQIKVSAKGAFDQPQHTSVTFAAVDGEITHRFTIAIRTGPPEQRKILLAPSPVPSSTPAPEKK